MGLKIENIDRAILWAIKDEIIRQGKWPAERTFIANNDEAGLNNAIFALGRNAIDIFGVGNYTDREQLRTNQLIITRGGPDNGMVGFGQPFHFELQADLTYNKINKGDGSSMFYYEIRAVCDLVEYDRIIESVIQNALGRMKRIYGINADFTNMAEWFWIERQSQAIDLSSKDYIERVFPYIIRDVFIDEDRIAQTGIRMTTQLTNTPNVPPGREVDLLDPDLRDDVPGMVMGPTDFFLNHLNELACWEKFDVCRFYATDTQAHALKNLRGGSLDAVNTGLTFAAYRGFTKTGAGQFLNTKFKPGSIQNRRLGLSNYSYSIFISTVPAGSTLMELFGLVDGGGAVKFILTSAAATIAAGNEAAGINLNPYKVKANTLYVVNRKSNYEIELWENNKVIARAQTPVTAFPAGTVFELGVGDETDSYIGTSLSGGILFSAAGSALKSSEIIELNIRLRFMLSKVGAIPD